MLALDPLLTGHFDWGVVVIVMGKVVVIFGILLVSVLFMVWFERKVHRRHAEPHRPEPGRPVRASCRRWPTASSCSSRRTCCPGPCRPARLPILAPFLSFVPAFLVFSVDPARRRVHRRRSKASSTIFGHETFLQLADPPIGVLLVLACSSIAVYGVMLAGWSSGSKYPLLGSVRASAQMVVLRGGARAVRRHASCCSRARCRTHEIVMTQASDGSSGSFHDGT